MSRHAQPVRPFRFTSVRTTCVLLATALLVLFASPSPALAGGTAYDIYTWAGVRAWGWNDNTGTWPAPTRVTAQWQVPCLSTTSDRYGAYDQWIGIEGTQGTLIQVGVRSYHVNTVFGVVTGYFAWVVDTRDPAVSTPQRVFTIVRCGFGTSSTPYPIVTAEVNADGRVRIEATDTGNTWEPTAYRRWWTGIGYPESARYGSFILERFTSSASNTLPQFGSAGFRWCWAGSVTTSGWLLGNQDYVRSARTDMVSYLPHPPFTSAWPAVLTGDWIRGGDGAVHGDFNFAQFLNY